MTDLRKASDFWAAYEGNRRSPTALSRATGIPVRTVENWKKYHEAGRVWDGEKWTVPESASRFVEESADPVATEAKRLREAHEKREHRVYTQEAARTEIILSHLKAAVSGLPAVKVKPPYFASTGRKRSPMSLVVHLSDFHYGEVVDPEEIMSLNAYDPEVAARRLYQLETLVMTAMDVIGRAHPVPELRLLMLGDMVSGAIHNEIAETNEYNLYEQWAQLSLLLAQFVLRLAGKFEKVTIDGVPGNHGRTTQKPSAKQKYVNWDYLMYQTLSLMLASQPNVVCCFPRSPITSVEIQGWRYLLWHGDSIKSWAGIPFYGVERAIARLRELMQVKGIQFHYAALGHFHTGAEIQRAVGEVLMNPSLKGGDEFSVNNLYSYAPPSQLLYFMHKEHGKTWQLRNDLANGDKTPHPYVLEGGDSLADSYQKAEEVMRVKG